MRGESSSNSGRAEEENFWDIIFNLLPFVIPETEPIEPEIIETEGKLMQGEHDPMTGRETLLSTPKKKNKEFLVYTKRKHQQKSIARAIYDQEEKQIFIFLLSFVGLP